MFPGRLISHFGDITRPARSPDLAVTDYFLWGYVTSKLYKTCPANTDKLRHRILVCIQRIPNYVLWQPFHRHCRSVLNDMVVTVKVSYSNNNDWDEFSWTWNTPNRVNKIFPLFLKKLFHSKNRQVFMTHPVLWNFPLITFYRILSSSNLKMRPARPSLLILISSTTFIYLHKL